MVVSKLDALKITERMDDLPQNVNFVIRTHPYATCFDATGTAPYVNQENVI